MREGFEALFAKNQPYDVECRIRRRDGEWVWVHDRALKTYEKNGIRCADGLLSDITERKRAEDELLFKTALLEAQSETTIDGILVVDTTEQVLLVNKQFARMWGFPDETIRTKDDRILIEHVRGQVKDPEAFLEKVRYLYTHKAEKSQDEIELKSGRVFDRYSSPCRTPRASITAGSGTSATSPSDAGSNG